MTSKSRAVARRAADRGRTTVERRARDAVRAYAEAQSGQAVVRLVRTASEMVGPSRHDIWDVHSIEGRWWVLTNPRRLYDQATFPNHDDALTLHVGMALRAAYHEMTDVPMTARSQALLAGSWRLWQEALNTLEGAEKPHDFRAVGLRLRECLRRFVAETGSDALVPAGEPTPDQSDFTGWSSLLATYLAIAANGATLRSYLQAMADGTWQLVQSLTAAKDAQRLDAELCLKAVEHLLGVFTAARLRYDQVAIENSRENSGTINA